MDCMLHEGRDSVCFIYFYLHPLYIWPGRWMNVWLNIPTQDFPGDPLLFVLPIQGAWVPSLVRELDPTCTH